MQTAVNSITLLPDLDFSEEYEVEPLNYMDHLGFAILVIISLICVYIAVVVR